MYELYQGEVSNARVAAERAEKTSEKTAKSLKESEEGLTPVKQVTIDALEQWKKVGVDYEKIIDERFSQRREDRLTAKKIGSALEVDGQIVGVERIREHIFKITDAAWWAKGENRELARRMLSDEAIAKGIIETFGIDTGGKTISIMGIGNITYENCFTEISTRRQTLDDARDKLIEEKAKGTKGNALKQFEDAVNDANTEIKKYEQPLLREVLPYLQQGNEFQIGDTMRYLIRQGLDSASDGRPFWYGDQGEEYTKPEAELTLEAASILEEHKGRAIFIETNKRGQGEAPRVQWEGELQDIQFGALGFPILNPTAELTFRIIQDLDRTQASATVDVMINENFLQTLPDRLTTPVADSIRELFYDNNDTPPTLRTEIRARDRSTMERLFNGENGRQIDNKGNMWLNVVNNDNRDNLRENSSEQLLDMINMTVSPEAATDIAVSTANTILQMTPDQRLSIVKGLDEVFVPNFQILEAPGTTVDVAMQYDNEGNLWILNNAGGPRQPLETFYQEREEAYRRSLGVQTLNPVQRATLREQFRRVQEELGRAVLLRQQLR